MKDFLGQIMNENLEYHEGSLDFSGSEIELNLSKNEKFSGSFQIKGNFGQLVEGYLYASNERMQIGMEEFSGEEVKVPYAFDSVGLEEGDILKGEIAVVSNKGEYTLPFIVNILGERVQTSIGNVKNLFHFANLAKTNWGEAVRLFYSKDFKSILTGNDRQYRKVYRGLSKLPGLETNVEEFLVNVNKKQRIEYSLKQDNGLVEEPIDLIEETMGIEKNGWGYTRLIVSVEGDFLSVEKEILTDDEFLGNNANLKYYININKLHSGNNFGKIRLHNLDTELEYNLVVTKGANRRLARKRQKRQHALLLQLMELYLEFRTKKVPVADWLKQSETVVEELNSLDERNPMCRLFQAQLLITAERYNEAKWVLDHVESLLQDSKDETPELWCYYLYLCTLYDRNEKFVAEATNEIEAMYAMHHDSWRILWLLFYLKEEYSRNPIKKWVLLEEQFKMGCTSPVLYVEAIHLLNGTPNLLGKLSDYELQLILFAAKRGLLIGELTNQILYLAAKERTYSDKLYQVLVECYQVRMTDEFVQAICTLLIKGNLTGTKYLRWYQMAVDKELRITRLYDYYMMSVEMDYKGELPRIVLMYFAYQCNLDYAHTAYLYARVYMCREQYPEIYRSYREAIKKFLIIQLEKRHINKDLSVLYQGILMKMPISDEMCEQIADILFLYEVKINNLQYKRVIVVHENFVNEEVYPITNGNAIVTIYGKEYQLFLEDAEGNRSGLSDGDVVCAFMEQGKISKAMATRVSGCIGFDLYLCDGSKNYIGITQDNENSYLRLLESEKVSRDYQKQISTKLAQYYYDHDKMRELDALLEKIAGDDLDAAERSEFIRLMIIRGMYDKAYSWISQYGITGIEVKSLVRLCSRIITRDKLGADKEMVRICHETFQKGKYDEVLLRYLVDNFNGLTRQMRDVWKAAKSFYVDANAICERIIVQMLLCQSYLGEQTEIFKAYVKDDPSPEIVYAYLTANAYGFFVSDQLVDEFVFRCIIQMAKQGQALNTVCKLAALKHFAEQKLQRDEESDTHCILFMNEMLAENIFFPFYLEYSDIIPGVWKFADRTMIEYKASPNHKVVLHYVLGHGEGEGEYHKENMRDMYGGIFVKDFVLFFGESMQYYITEEMNGNEQLTESGTIDKNDIGKEAKESRYQMLNDIVIGMTLQDYDTVDNLMEEYLRKDYQVQKLFHLL